MAFDNYSGGNSGFGGGFGGGFSDSGFGGGSQGGYSYGGQSGYPAQQGYGGQSGYPTQQGYGAQTGYPAQQGYGAQSGYPAQQGYGAQGYDQNNYYYNQGVPASQPALQLKTNRALWKMILFSVITVGIYPIIVWSNIGTSLNEAAGRYDGKHTMHFCLVTFLFSWLTLGILPLIWMSNTYARVGHELARRGINYRVGAGTFWLWNVLGSFILAGPFIALHKMCTGMNLICADYNAHG